jgi:hypothetical protein
MPEGWNSDSAGQPNRFFYFQHASSRSCATDCLGISIGWLHSVQTLTRTFENETRMRSGWMVRASNRVATGFRQAEHMPDEMSPSCHGACIVTSPQVFVLI